MPNNTKTTTRRSTAFKNYSRHKDELTVTFNNTWKYIYYDVPEPMIDQFHRSHNKGRYFNKHIRGEFPYMKVTSIKPKSKKPTP